MFDVPMLIAVDFVHLQVQPWFPVRVVDDHRTDAWEVGAKPA